MTVAIGFVGIGFMILWPIVAFRIGINVAKVLGDLPHLKTAAINVLRSLDRSAWPEAARDSTPELVAIELEDEDIKEGIFTLRFESPADPEADYFVDFRSGAVESAERLA